MKQQEVPAPLGISSVHQIPVMCNCVSPTYSLETWDAASWFGCHPKVPLLWADLKPKVYCGLEQWLCPCSGFRHAVRLCGACTGQSVCWGSREVRRWGAPAALLGSCVVPA